LLHDPAARERMAKAGAECIRQSAGATQRHVLLLRKLVGKPAGVISPEGG